VNVLSRGHAVFDHACTFATVSLDQMLDVMVMQ
jgi:hypothetical protein